LPEAKMLVYGAYPSPKVMQLHNPKMKFEVLGRAEDAFEVIKKAKVMLAPLRFGAGLKGKLLEAMQCGTPSVTSSIGAEAMTGGMEWNGFISDDANDFVTSVVQLYRDENLWETCQANGYAILENRYHKNLFESNFMKKVSMVTGNLYQHRKANFIGSILNHHLNLSTKYMSRWIEEKNKTK
jgi:glycosyltransferase involved in cell wall biosynthesis